MHDEEKKESKWATAVSIAGRIAGMGLALAAAVLMSTASQCTVYYTAAYGGAARPRTVTYSNFPKPCFPPFVYLVGAASIAAFLEAIAIFLVVWKKGKVKTAKVLMPLLGVAVPALLYSATGATFAESADMSYCSANGKRVNICAGSAAGAGGGSSNFCSQVHISVYLALAAAVAVSVAEVVMGLGGSASSGDSDSDSSSSESGGCAHGCHHKH